jgi:hypothetical protein
MRLYGAIQKIEPLDDGTVRVHGIATSEAVDDQGEIVRADAIRAAIPDYMRFPALREMHQLSAAGTTLEIEIDNDGVTRIVGHVVDPVAVSKVRNQVYRGFSIGGRVTQRDPVNSKTITGLTLSEISLVDRPANPEAVFDCWKASQSGDTTMPDGALATLADTDAGKALAALAATVQIWTCADPTHHHVAKAEAVQCIEKQAAGEDASDKSAETSGSVADASAQLEAVLDADPAPTPEEIEKRAADGAAEAQAVMDAAMKAIDAGDAALAELDKRETPEAEVPGDAAAAEGDDAAKADKPKGDYGDVEYADPGYQDDKKPRYPIDTEAHIRSAWNYINQEKNCAKYGDNCAKVKAKIVAAWKSKIDKDGPPSAEKASLVKTLNDASDLVSVILFLDSLQERLAYEAAVEGDSSAMPAKVAALCAQTCAALRDLIAEETAEIMAGTEMDDDDGVDVMMMAGLIAELRKAGKDDLADSIEKAGAKNSAHDQALLDMAYAATDKCMKTDGCTAAMTKSLGGAMDEMKAAGAQPWAEGSSDSEKAALALDLAKKHGGHQALMDVAHDCLGKMSGGATCADDAAKAGARNSREKMGHLQKAHEYLAAAGANCEPPGDAAKVATEAAAGDVLAKEASDPAASDAVAKTSITIDLVKTADGDFVLPPILPPAIAKLFDAERAEKAELVKTIGTIIPMLDRLTARVEVIANTPLPPLGYKNTLGAVAITKGQDGAPLTGGSASGGTRPSFEQMLKSMPAEVQDAYAKLPNDEQSLFMIRYAFGQPLPYDPVTRILRAA